MMGNGIADSFEGHKTDSSFIIDRYRGRRIFHRFQLDSA